jgi:hypothetical protein
MIATGLAVLLLITGCGGPAVAVSPATSSPALSAAVSPSPATSPAPPPTITSPSASATATATAIASPKAAEVTETINKAEVDFPERVTFTLTGTSASPVKTIILEYCTDIHSVVSQISRVEPQYAKSTQISTNYVWEMKKTGSIPPGVRITWQWRIMDETGGTYASKKQTLVYTDDRFIWQSKSLKDIDIYWSVNDSRLIDELAVGLEARLATLKLNVPIPPERKPRVFVYSSSEQIKSAILFSHDWTGALAFPWYNIVLTTVNTSNLEWAKGTIAHEIAHLIVGEAVFGPFGNIPNWLAEGLAERAESAMPEHYKRVINDAIAENRLFSMQSLSSSFSTDATDAFLCYAQSTSFVTFLIDTGGWEKMQQLLAVYKEGSTTDKALMKIYGFDLNAMEAQWRAKIGAR